MGVAVSSSHFVSAAPSFSGGGLLTFCPCSIMGSLPQETVLHKLLQCNSFPWAAAIHELPQSGSFPWGAFLHKLAEHGSLPQGAVLQEQGFSSVGPPCSHKPCQQACSRMGSRLHRSRGPGRSLLQHELPMGSQPPSGIHLLWHGVHSTGYRWISAPP